MLKPIQRLIEGLYFKIPGNLALYDQLTHTYNSNWLRSIAYDKYATELCYVTLVDLNDFKQINDYIGHFIGDVVLEGIGAYLRTVQEIDPEAEICRSGGDEFIIFSKIDITSYLAEDTNQLVSFGTCRKRSNLSIKNAIRIADARMYKYKKDNKEIITSRQDLLDRLHSVSFVNQDSLNETITAQSYFERQHGTV